MFYTLVMDDEEANWVVDLFKRLQRSHIVSGTPEITDLDVERAQSFISRIRATTKRAPRR